MLDTELAPRIAARVLLTAFLVMGLSAAGPAVPSPARGAIPPQGLTVLLAGDSVPLYLEDTLADVMDDELGWHLISAAVPACSIYGDALAWPNGEPKGDPERCPGLVAPLHASLVQQHDPDVVIWWDRLSTMPFLTEGGDFVQSGSDRFWELRAIGFQDTIGRLRAGGARIVFVATEPTGIAFKKRCAGSTRPSCVWNRFRVRHYSDVTQPLNRTMRQYAAAFPAEAVFISITDTVCRWNVSPCDDRMWNGELARPDGTHYEGRGEMRASRAIVLDMQTALYG